MPMNLSFSDVNKQFKKLVFVSLCVLKIILIMKNKKGQDIYERICFLFEAAYTLMLACPSNVSLICSYGHMIKMLARRSQSKLGPYIKRQICKRCHLILRPGVTSVVKLKNTNSKHIQVTCKFCGTVKRFPSSPNYELFYDKIKALKSQ